MIRHAFLLELEEAQKMHLVERMTQSPPSCMVCGRGNTPDPAGEIGPFLDLERSVNWDDSTYLCRDCAFAIGAEFGMLLPEEVVALRREIRQLHHQLHEEKAKRREKVNIA